MRILRDRRLLDVIGEAFALGDIERIAEPFIVGTKSKKPAHERLIRAVPFPGTGERAVQLQLGMLRSPAGQRAAQQTDATRARGMRGRRADHDRADNVEKRNHGDGATRCAPRHDEHAWRE